MSDNSEKLQRNKVYPCADQPRGHMRRHVGAVWSGERRPPKAGEWYLSGALIEAFRARNDLIPSYPIAKIHKVKRITTVELGEEITEAPATRSSMTVGTSHFVSEESAIRYYTDYGYSDVREAVTQKLRDGEIHIGKPPLKENQKLRVIDDGTRYAIEEGVN